MKKFLLLGWVASLMIATLSGCVNLQERYSKSSKVLLVPPVGLQGVILYNFNSSTTQPIVLKEVDFIKFSYDALSDGINGQWEVLPLEATKSAQAAISLELFSKSAAANPRLKRFEGHPSPEIIQKVAKSAGADFVIMVESGVFDMVSYKLYGILGLTYSKDLFFAPVAKLLAFPEINAFDGKTGKILRTIYTIDRETKTTVILKEASEATPKDIEKIKEGILPLYREVLVSAFKKD